MNIDLMVASNNEHKLEEFKDLFSNSIINVYSAKESIDVEETGKTFMDNAHLKAYAYYQKFKKPVFADDSGLIVDFLPNELGVYSARFGGGGLNSLERCQLLLKKLEGVSDKDRTAKFVCTLCVILNDYETYFFEGEVKGKIAHELKGSGGFGYDPLFLPDEIGGKETLAEVFDWKQKNSHRARASQKLLNFFQKKSCQK